MAAGNQLPDQTGSWQTSFFETGDQPSTNIAMRQHGTKYGGQGSFQFYIEVDGRQCVAADMTCGLVERDDTTMTYRCRCPSYHRNGIRLVMQNVTTDRSIERGSVGKFLIRGNDELNLLASGRKRPSPPYFDGNGFAIECNDATGIADGLGE